MPPESPTARASSRDWARPRRVLAFAAVDAVAIAVALVLSFLVRFDGSIPTRLLPLVWHILLLSVAAKIPVFFLFRLYRFSWAHVGMEELFNVLLGCAVGSLGLVAALFVLRDTSAFATAPRSIPAIDFAFTLLGVAGLRVGKRLVRHALSSSLRRKPRSGKRTLVVGAGEAGENLVRALLGEERPSLWPVGFVDDDPAKRGLVIHGVRVLGPRKSVKSFVDSAGAEVVLIAMPSASPHVIRETVDLARAAGVKDLKILPQLSKLYSGQVRISEVRELQPEDVLRRDPIPSDTRVVEQFLLGKSVLVTGAAGSIGSELCRQALGFGAGALFALDIDETGLFNLENDLHRLFPDSGVAVLVGDVRDEASVARALAGARPNMVFHAAAYKHVPMMEAFPEEAVKTNVFGTEIVVRTACETGVEALVLISTDKAVNPTSIMGATKRTAEKVMLAAGQGSATRCIGVRFGNVLGSRGSVLLTFLEQIRRGGPVTVTDPEMRRYFMTTAEAVNLVLQASAMGEGGEVFVLDMGEPVRILDLASDLIRFHGLVPDQDIAITIMGIRPGEKLFEELLTAEEGTEVTSHKRISVARLGRPWSSDLLAQHLGDLHSAEESGSRERIVEALQAAVPTFQPASTTSPPH